MSVYRATLVWLLRALAFASFIMGFMLYNYQARVYLAAKQNLYPAEAAAGIQSPLDRLPELVVVIAPLMIVFLTLAEILALLSQKRSG